MGKKLFKYQEEAIENLLSEINKYLKKESNKNVVLQAPTGSGKTIMMAELLQLFVSDRKDDKSFSFIWAAPRKLHNQSKEKLENYYKESRILECLNIEDLSETKIDENEILFFNWESINKKDNVFVNENERNFNLTSVVDNTLEEGREIILIIDESHHTSTAPNTRGLIEMMKARITIEVSATPPDAASDHTEKVEFKDVVKEGMIKKEVSINPGLKEDKLEGEGSDEFILKEALKKREELKNLFEKDGKKINPLLLIQLPDKSKYDNEDTRKEIMIEELLVKKFKIDRKKKLAFYLSEDKENLENITKNEDDAEVLMFKHAIALGWDCPRAYILVLFREWHSETFKIQTVGRIMRMPELRHYKNEILNKGYVYTNIANTKINIAEEIAKDYFTIYTSERVKNYKNIDLVSYHIKRQRETTRLAPSFINMFLENSKSHKLKDKLDLKLTKVTDHIPIDATLHLENYRTAQAPVEVLKDISLAKTTIELELALKLMIDETMREGGMMFPEKRSVGRIISSIYNFFNEELKLKYEEKEKEIIAMVLNKDNLQHFKDVINLSLKEYKRLNPPDKNKVEANDELWNVPEKLELNANHKKEKKKLNVMSPFYVSTSQAKHWETEVSFMEFLDEHKMVEWWFKNGERDGTYFAVPYTDNYSEDQVFYVDFIVKMKDGRIGLFDTKSGWTAEAPKAGPKSKGLQKYIADENKKGKNLFGGIIVPKGGSFWTYTKTPYKYDKDLTGWEILGF